jgi:hypothetical protein
MKKSTFKLLLLGGLGAVIGNMLWVMRGLYWCHRYREELEINRAERQMILALMRRGLNETNPNQDCSQN